jgi:hypothetical protein
MGNSDLNAFTNGGTMCVNEPVTTERKRLATALRKLASETFEAAGRLSATPCNPNAVKKAVVEAAVARKIADLIEEGKI